jgi:hypothetical protein
MRKCHGGQGEKRSKGGTSLFPTNQKAEMMPHHLGPVRRSLRDSLFSIKLEARIDGLNADGGGAVSCLPMGQHAASASRRGCGDISCMMVVPRLTR